MGKDNDYYVYYIMLENRKFFVTNYKTNLMSIDDIKSTSSLCGPDWMLINRPICIIKIIKNNADFEIDDYVINLMSIEGIKNVRGGSYINTYISPETEICILRRVNNSYIPINYGDYIEESDSDTSSEVSNVSNSGYMARAYRWLCFKKVNNKNVKETLIR